MRGNRRWGTAVVALLSTLLGPGQEAVAQSQSAGGGEPVFTPSITFLGSLSRNPARIAGDSTRADFYAVVGDLPFRFRAPRWRADFAYRPGYQQFRNDTVTTSFEHMVTMMVEGQLSQRATLRLAGDAYVSNEIQGLDATEVVVPRTRQVRGDAEARLQYKLGALDTLSVSGRYRRSDFLDIELAGSDVFALAVGYQRALSPRLYMAVRGRGQLARFEAGGDARTLSTVGVVGYRTGRFTEVSIDAGLLWVRQLDGAGLELVDGSASGVILGAGLSHRSGRFDMGLRARRDAGFTSGTGEATIQDRLLATVATGNHRWSAFGAGGFARNHRIATAGVSPSLSDPRAIDTLTGCFGGGVRVSSGVSVVGSALYAHQVGGSQSEFDIDTYRVALGVRLEMNPYPMAAASSSGSASIGRSARAAC